MKDHIPNRTVNNYQYIVNKIITLIIQHFEGPHAQVNSKDVLVHECNTEDK